MEKKIDYEADHYCPVYDRVINGDLCYDSLFALHRYVKVSSVKELNSVEDIEGARKLCNNCPYSNDI